MAHFINAALPSASQPAKAVWIEILPSSLLTARIFTSQPAKAVWIEMVLSQPHNVKRVRHSLRRLCGLKYGIASNSVNINMSQPAKAVWIEITNWSSRTLKPTVTACEGCVD